MSSSKITAHGTIRDREKTMRAMDNSDSAEVFIEGFKGIDLDLAQNTWKGLIEKRLTTAKRAVPTDLLLA